MKTRSIVIILLSSICTLIIAVGLKYAYDLIISINWTWGQWACFWIGICIIINVGKMFTAFFDKIIK